MSAEIDFVTAMKLRERGYSVVPCQPGEKRPAAHLGNWRRYSDTLPTPQELETWFAAPRRGGVVLHKGQIVVDYDTKDTPPGEGECFEESAKGYHVFYRCAADAKIEHDHEKKIDYLTCGSFVRLCEPRKLLDWKGELPEFSSGASGSGVSKSNDSSDPGTASPSSILEVLKSQGWRVGGKASNGWFSLTNGSKTAAMSEDGSVIKMFSTTLCERPAEAVEPLPEPVIKSAAELAAEDPQLSEPVVNFCRRGSFALVSGDPKAGKTTLALKICAKKSKEGYRCLYADFENGPALFWHRLRKIGDAADLENIRYLDCRYSPSIDYIASAMRAAGGIDLLVIDCWGLLIAGDGVEDESSNALVSSYFLRVRRTLAEFNAATVILHHTPKSGANEKLCFAGAGASSLQRYVQTIARISQDKSGAYWFNALCREFDEPFTPVKLR